LLILVLHTIVSIGGSNSIARVGLGETRTFTLKPPVFPNKLRARGQAKPAPEPEKKKR